MLKKLGKSDYINLLAYRLIALLNTLSIANSSARYTCPIGRGLPLLATHYVSS
jgi:hypothetical protein